MTLGTPTVYTCEFEQIRLIF